MGASDLKSELVRVPKGQPFKATLDGAKTGAQWKNKYGFVGVNADTQPYATDGMNEAGLTVGVLFYPGFAEYQGPSPAENATTITNVDIANYLLGNFATVEEVHGRCRTFGSSATAISRRRSARLFRSTTPSPTPREIPSSSNIQKAR